MRNLAYTFSRYTSLLLIAGLLLIIISCTDENSANDTNEATKDAIAQAASLADTAQLKLYVQWNWDAAEEAFKQAIELDPKLGRAHAHYGWYKGLKGDLSGAIEEMKLAKEAEPQNPLWPAWHVWLLLWKGDIEPALKAAQEGVDINPAFPAAQYVKGMALLEQGEAEAALKALELAAQDSKWKFGLGYGYAKTGNREKALEIAQQLGENVEPWNTWGLAEIYAALNETDLAFEWLGKAYEMRHPYIPWMDVNRNFEALRGDPRFKEIKEKIKLP